MGFIKAKREKVYVRVIPMAPSGCGKTYSSLRLAASTAQEIETKTGESVELKETRAKFS